MQTSPKIKILPEPTAKMKCRWCGGDIRIQPCDEEGNLKRIFYVEHPYSGLRYVLCHDLDDIPKGKHCPIATFKGQILGTRIYRTQTSAIYGYEGNINE